MKTIAQYMKAQVYSIDNHASIRDAIQLCVTRHIGTLPVVDAHGRLVGTVRLADMIDLGLPVFFQFLDHIEFIHTFGALELKHPGAEVLNRPVTAIMKEAVSVEDSAGLLRASALLFKNQLMDVTVMDGQHRMVIGLLGAVLMVSFGIAFGFYSEELAAAAIDFNTIGLLLGMMVLIALLEPTGLPVPGYLDKPFLTRAASSAA